MKSDPDLMVLGRGIQRCRARATLSQEKLGELADLHRNYIGLLERGERNPKATTLIAIARALNTRPADLWSEFD